VLSLENKAEVCDSEINRLDSNLVLISEGLEEMQDGQHDVNSKLDKRISGVERFVAAMKHSIVTNKGVAFWTGLEEDNQ